MQFPHSVRTLMTTFNRTTAMETLTLIDSYSVLSLLKVHACFQSASPFQSLASLPTVTLLTMPVMNYHWVWTWEVLFLEFSTVTGLHKGPPPFPNFCTCYWPNLRHTSSIPPLLLPPESIQSPWRWKQYVPPKYWGVQLPHSVRNLMTTFNRTTSMET